MANYKTGAQRRNDRMDKIFDNAYELAARKAGWERMPASETWVRESTADEMAFSNGEDKFQFAASAKKICKAFDLIGLRS
jgi:hypothetical protein